jgi:Glycosyl hydrolase family 47
MSRGAAFLLPAALAVCAACRLSSSPPASAPAAAPALGNEPVDRVAMAARVRQEFLHAWSGYQRHAWGWDELKPLSRRGRNWYRKSFLITPVDALDTMLLMGLDAEAAKTRAMIDANLSFNRSASVKNFEVTIRLLGGLLSSYQMTGDARLLSLAEDLGTRLLPAFDSPTGMPYRFVNLKTGKLRDPKSNPAEIGSLLLEFGTLGRLTHRPIFYDKAKNAVVALYQRRSEIGLVGEKIDVRTGRWIKTTSHIDGGIDSYYEYLLKSARLFDDADCRKMWEQSIPAVNGYIADERPNGLWYGEADMRTGRRVGTEFGALQAFFPAVLALSGDVGRAERLEDSCFRMWSLYGVEPDLLDYRSMAPVDPRYPLRPEIIESAYYLYHFTKDPKYLRMGQAFFEGLVRYCRTDEGYTVLKSVVTKKQGDLMPSYFLAETLKYLYLLFAPDHTLDFDSVVFNTEAHPLRRVGALEP